MTIVDGANAPTSCSSNASTAASSERIRWARSAPTAASRGSRTARAPKRSSACAFSKVRFQTTTSSPRRRSASTNPEPIKPAPYHAILAITLLPPSKAASPNGRYVPPVNTMGVRRGCGTPVTVGRGVGTGVGVNVGSGPGGGA